MKKRKNRKRKNNKKKNRVKNIFKRNLKKKNKKRKIISSKIKKQKISKKRYYKKKIKIKIKKNVKKKNKFKKIKKKIIIKTKPFRFKDLFLKLYNPIKIASLTFLNHKKNQIKNRYINYLENRKIEKLKKLEIERKEKEKKIKEEELKRIQIKEQALKDEIKIARQRTKDIKYFLKKEQAEIRKEQAERQRKFLSEIKLEKKLENFRKREIKELQNLEKLALKEQRSDYASVQERIEDIKQKYRNLRDEKIRQRVEQLGVQIEEGDDRDALLEKEKKYTLERQKIENTLESFYRCSASLCFQINKRYIPKHRSILRTIDRRFETGEIFIKWDDSEDEDWILLIYIKNNSPKEGIIIEDKSNPEKSISHELKTTEIFKASDLMVDSLIQLLERERQKKAS
ncbi:MAG: hypothetical protein CBC24_06090 [Candidatus Pelagibacter sp. TMED64]|nr:hypothetical protein [Candidatus Pelagibacter sp.]OUU65063.1 MAG: hypothetical protein CBC24_06090 [Candidatus Pelagibacter sp. TMED64]